MSYLRTGAAHTWSAAADAATQSPLSGVRGNAEITTTAEVGNKRSYGDSFRDGFAAFKGDPLCDVKVTITEDGSVWPLHALLLASRSDYFAAALRGDYAEAKSREIPLSLEAAAPAFPALVDYFYDDRIELDDHNVLPLLSLAKRLLIGKLEHYCLDYIQLFLNQDTCVPLLQNAVQLNLESLQDRCLAMLAEGFHLLYNADLAGLPVVTMKAMLRHPQLQVHCELQVLECVVNYLEGTQVEATDAAELCSLIRFAFLDNASIHRASQHPCLPRTMVLEGALHRLTCMDLHSGAEHSGKCYSYGQAADASPPVQSVGQQGEIALSFLPNHPQASALRIALHDHPAWRTGRAVDSAPEPYAAGASPVPGTSPAARQNPNQRAGQARQGGGSIAGVGGAGTSRASVDAVATATSGTLTDTANGNEGGLDIAITVADGSAGEAFQGLVEQSTADLADGQTTGAGQTAMQAELQAAVEALAMHARPTYCCNLAHGMPGGSSYLDVDLGSDAVWQNLVQNCVVRVSGISEGTVSNVLCSSNDASGWFETDDCGDPLPWVQVELPDNVQVLSLSRLTYAHGHRRAGYYRLRNWKVQVADELGAPLTDVPTRMLEQFDIQVAASGKPFQVLRVQATGPQEDGVHRLCMRNLRLHGTARIDLLRQRGGLAVNPSWIHPPAHRPLLSPGPAGAQAPPPAGLGLHAYAGAMMAAGVAAAGGIDGGDAGGGIGGEAGEGGRRHVFFQVNRLGRPPPYVL